MKSKPTNPTCETTQRQGKTHAPVPGMSLRGSRRTHADSSSDDGRRPAGIRSERLRTAYTAEDASRTVLGDHTMKTRQQTAVAAEKNCPKKKWPHLELLRSAPEVMIRSTTTDGSIHAETITPQTCSRQSPQSRAVSHLIQA
jgi:hypothetical protein